MVRLVVLVDRGRGGDGVCPLVAWLYAGGGLREYVCHCQRGSVHHFGRPTACFTTFELC